MRENVLKTDYGYQLVWANTDTYCGKIHVFEKENSKTDMIFHENANKSWFVNSGTFTVRWLDTTNGKLLEQTVKEGKTFHIAKLTPCSLESHAPGGSVTECADGDTTADSYTIIPASNIGSQNHVSKTNKE